jgi:lysophospholipase L1-like esterase
VVLLVACEAILTLARVTPLAADPEQQEWLRFRRCQFQQGSARRVCDPAALRSQRPRVVVALGGSSVFGYPVDKTVPFPAALQDLLDARFPGEFSVFNRGRSCKDTIFVRDCARAALAAPVDVLVVYEGHNDYANWGMVNPRLRIFLEEQAWLLELDEWLAHTRTYSWVVDLARGGTPPLRGGLGAPDPERARRALAVILDKTRENLEAVIAMAGRAGTRVVLITQVSNLYDFPVARDDWDDGPRRLVAQDPGLAAWRVEFERGIAFHRAGAFAEAVTAFKRARDLYPRGRADSRHNALVRELAAAHPHVELVDFEAELDRRGAEEGIGCNFFGDRFPDEAYCDQFHPNSRTHRWIAEAVMQALAAERGATAQGGRLERRRDE